MNVAECVIGVLDGEVVEGSLGVRVGMPCVLGVELGKGRVRYG